MVVIAKGDDLRDLFVSQLKVGVRHEMQGAMAATLCGPDAGIPKVDMHAGQQRTMEVRNEGKTAKTVQAGLAA